MADFNTRAAENTLATTGFNNWAYQDKHVQQKLPQGKFVSGATTLLCAGPPSLDMTTDLLDAAFENSQALLQFAFPIGLTVSVNANQQKNIQRLFEIGSYRHYMVPGRTYGSMSIGRAYYNGPSLLKVAYAFYQPLLAKNGWTDLAKMYLEDTPGDVEPSMSAAGMPDITIRQRPGADNMFMNLSSDLFNNPIGLLMVFRDSHEGNVAAVYGENCLITNHSFGVGAESMVLSESASIMVERFIPVRLGNYGV